MKGGRRTAGQAPVVLTRLYPAALAFFSAVLIGGAGYRVIGDGLWSWSDCFYMAIVTLSTVGFAETLEGMDQMPHARAWTIVLILLGSGTLLYFASTLTALIVEGDLQGYLRRNQMNRLLDKVHDHIIVCGVGATGSHVATELARTHHSFVVIDIDPERIERMALDIGPFLHVIGDASEDHILEEAGIERARGLIATVHEDRDNLFITITARALNDKMRIITKSIEPESESKILRAGANDVVSPSLIGGMRMASAMIRPTVVQFMDEMLRDKRASRRIEEIHIPPTSPLIGKTLSQVNFRQWSDALVIAVRQRDGTHYYNPTGETELAAGQVLMVMLETDQVAQLRQHVHG